MDGRDDDEPVASETARPTLADGGDEPPEDPVAGEDDEADPSDETDGGTEEATAGDDTDEATDDGSEEETAGDDTDEATDDGSEEETVGDDAEEETSTPDEAGGVPVTRRQAIFGAGALGVLGAGIGVSHLLRPARAVGPDVPRQALESNDWTRVDAVAEPVLQDSAGPVSIEAVASTVRYRNQGLVTDIKNRDVTVEYDGDTRTERLGDYTAGQFDQPLGVFVATKIDVTPHVDELPAGIGRAQVMDPVRTQASNQFERQLREAGLQNVREVEPTTSFEPDSGASATQFEFRGAFTFDQTSVDVQGVSLTIPGGAIEIAGYLAAWHDGRNVIVAAGAHPSQNYTDTVTRTVAGSELSVNVDLGLRPSGLREELLGYMATVE